MDYTLFVKNLFLCRFIDFPASEGKQMFQQVQASRSRLNATISKFNQKAEETQNKLVKNPFSDTYQRPDTSGYRYGRPEAGSKTEKRGIKAGDHIGREIYHLCELIDMSGDDIGEGKKTVTFGYLFRLYTRISDKVVEMLIRAKKYGLVHFEGEMLYQRQDDHKIVTLLKPLEEIRMCMKQSGDPKECVKFDLSK